MKLKMIWKNVYTVGEPKIIGEKIEDFYLIDRDLKKIFLNSIQKEFTIISFFPSLDTPVCSLQVRKMNKKIIDKINNKNISVLNVSCDLPFAQKRFCIEHNLNKKMYVLSDYQGNDFGIKAGVLLKDLKILCRGVFVIDKDNIVKYVEIVSNIVKQISFSRLITFIDSL